MAYLGIVSCIIFVVAHSSILPKASATYQISIRPFPSLKLSPNKTEITRGNFSPFDNMAVHVRWNHCGRYKEPNGFEERHEKGYALDRCETKF